MKLKLNSIEQRIIGCLIEKELTTPDQYPLSLNALTNACNQKSNREPVMSLDEVSVQKALDELSKKHLVVDKASFGSRTSKYQHRFCNTEFSDLKFSAQEVGILCVLFLRGPQTPGELRTRTNRLCKFTDVDEVELVLDKLASHPAGPFVKKLARQPGKRESRYLHLFGDTENHLEIESVNEGIDGFEQVTGNERDATTTVSYEQRIIRLESDVADLRAEVSELKNIIGQLI